MAWSIYGSRNSERAVKCRDSHTSSPFANNASSLAYGIAASKPLRGIHRADERRRRPLYRQREIRPCPDMRCFRAGRSHVHHRYWLYGERWLSSHTACTALLSIQLTGSLSVLSLSLDLPVDVGSEAFSVSVSVRFDDDEADDDCDLPSLPRDVDLGLSASSTPVGVGGFIGTWVGLIISSRR